MCLDKPDMLVVARCIHTNQTYFFLHDLLLSEFVFNLCFLCSPALVPPFYSIKLCLYLCLYFMFFFIEVGRRGVISDFYGATAATPYTTLGPRRWLVWVWCFFFMLKNMYFQSINQSLFASGKSPYTNRHTHRHTRMHKAQPTYWTVRLYCIS